MIKSSSMEINGQTLYIESGRIAKQANGSTVVTFGETVVLVTAVASDQVREGVDFLPLTVEYQEMSYAGGRIPGNFFRRDMGRPSEKETLTSRLIDRPLRPLFPKGYFFETQVIASVLSTDKENDADVLAMLGASAALEVSDIPFQGPIAGVRVGRVQGKFITNPTLGQQEESDIDLIVAGNRKGIVMVEAGSKFVSESEMIDAIFYGHEAMIPMLDLQDELKSAIGKPKKMLEPAPVHGELQERVYDLGTPLVKDIISTSDKLVRQRKRMEAESTLQDKLSDEFENAESEISESFHDLEKRFCAQNDS